MTKPPNGLLKFSRMKNLHKKIASFNENFEKAFETLITIERFILEERELMNKIWREVTTGKRSQCADSLRLREPRAVERAAVVSPNLNESKAK